MLPLLACPVCSQSLVLHNETIHDEHIQAGTFICGTCERAFPIQNGIPCFLVGRESPVTKQAFSNQWKLRYAGAFERTNRVFWLDNQQVLDYLERQLFPDLQEGDWILDAGCGSGEKAITLAQNHPELQVVALDFSETLSTMAANAQGLSNLHILQGDVMAPPFQPQSFQKIISIGVLHHTPNTQQAFQAIAHCVAPQGRLVVWLYPHPSESPWFNRFYYFFRDVCFVGQGHRLPPELRLLLLRLLCGPLFLLMPLFLLSRFIYARLYQNLTFSDIYRGLVFMLYDNLAPLYQFRHKKSEVIQWYHAAGFGSVSTPELGLYLSKQLAAEPIAIDV